MTATWRDDALCLGVASRDKDPWFPELEPSVSGKKNPTATKQGKKRAAAERRWAVALCERCPVRRQCLADAMKQEQGRSRHTRHGIFAGLGPRERETLDRSSEEQSA